MKANLLIAAAVMLLGSASMGAPAAWPSEFKEITVESTLDKTAQPAVFYAPPETKPVPLLVGLHTWSTNYQTVNRPYAEFCRKNSWAFIYPDFRGPNRNPASCGSEMAVQDILDAVAYARKEANIDPDRIYLIGNSGGGHMTLLMAGRHPEIWAAVACSVPISNLAAWHDESVNGKTGYWKSLEQVTGGAPGSSEKTDAEYRRRSPASYLEAARGKVTVDIMAGINDGHERRSVPVRQSLNAFNLLAAEKDRIPAAAIETITAERKVPPELAGEWTDPEYGRRKIHFRRTSDRVRVTIFEGGHEMLPIALLNWLSRQKRGAAADYSIPEKLVKSTINDTRVTE